MDPGSEIRAEHEKDFHDAASRHVPISSVDPQLFFRSPPALENHAALRFFGEPLQNRRLLDLGCGYGEATAYFAEAGANVDALDVSPKQIGHDHSIARVLREITQIGEHGSCLS